jgi:predicted nucleic-acid-binding protein
MRALDTNVLVRFLVRDDAKQAKRVLQLFEEAESTGETFLIPQLVVLELIWILGAVYDRTRDEILDSFDQLSMMPILEFERLDVLHRLLEDGRVWPTDLADLLIAHSACASGSESVLTFDKRASKHGLFSPL